jgi:hypothetical protein
MMRVIKFLIWKIIYSHQENIKKYLKIFFLHLCYIYAFENLIVKVG